MWAAPLRYCTTERLKSAAVPVAGQAIRDDLAGTAHCGTHEWQAGSSCLGGTISKPSTSDGSTNPSARHQAGYVHTSPSSLARGQFLPSRDRSGPSPARSSPAAGSCRNALNGLGSSSPVESTD